jgi:hypothetical protein
MMFLSKKVFGVLASLGVLATCIAVGSGEKQQPPKPQPVEKQVKKAPVPTKFVVPQQSIAGVGQYELGDIVELTINQDGEVPQYLVSSSYAWNVYEIVLDPKKGDFDFREKRVRKLSDTDILFGAGIVPKKYRIEVIATYLYMVKDGDNIKEVSTRTTVMTDFVIVGNPTPPVPPITIGNVPDISSQAGQQISVTPPSVSGGKSPYKLFYDFGDGTKTTENTHVYNTAGVYSLTVTVTDANSITATTGAKVTVTAAPNVPDGAFGLTKAVYNLVQTKVPATANRAKNAKALGDVYSAMATKLKSGTAKAEDILSETTTRNRAAITDAARQEWTPFFEGLQELTYQLYQDKKLPAAGGDAWVSAWSAIADGLYASVGTEGVGISAESFNNINVAAGE